MMSINQEKTQSIETDLEITTVMELALTQLLQLSEKYMKSNIEIMKGDIKNIKNIQWNF